MICPNCGSSVPDDALRCPACRAELDVTMRIPKLDGPVWCEGCGSLIPLDSPTCPGCGLPNPRYVEGAEKSEPDSSEEALDSERTHAIPRIESALSAVRMSSCADKAPHLLSGGQKQRVAIAGILAMEPSVIIADEATAMLDPSGRKEVLETIRTLNRQKGITVVWITHFMEEAALADRVLVVTDGQIRLSGTPAEVFDKVDVMREMHLDVPHMTALANELRAAGMPLRPGILTVEELAEEVEKLCPLKSGT